MTPVPIRTDTTLPISLWDNPRKEGHVLYAFRQLNLFSVTFDTPLLFPLQKGAWSSLSRDSRAARPLVPFSASSVEMSLPDLRRSPMQLWKFQD